MEQGYAGVASLAVSSLSPPPPRPTAGTGRKSNVFCLRTDLAVWVDPINNGYQGLLPEVKAVDGILVTAMKYRGVFTNTELASYTKHSLVWGKTLYWHPSGRLASMLN